MKQLQTASGPGLARTPVCPRLRPPSKAQQHARPAAFTAAAQKTFGPFRDVRARAAAVPQDSGGSLPQVAAPGGLVDTAVLGGLFGSWYIANIAFNVFNKQALQAFPFPLTLTEAQFIVGSTLAMLFWATGLVKRPKLSQDMLLKILPLAVVHTLGNLLTNVSLGAVAVSFTHTIKAMEPFFSVVLSSLFLGDQPHPAVLLTLLPIVGGVAAASLAEASFNWVGFMSAMGSNLTFQSRNVLSKKLMIKKGPGADALDNVNLFSIITVMSALLLLPFSLALEGLPSLAALKPAAQAAPMLVVKNALLAGLMFHSYQQISYMILQRVSPVTHSVGNCVKRVVVIVASVLVFQNPITPQAAMGTGVALAGVFAYSQVKRLTSPKAKAKTD